MSSRLPMIRSSRSVSSSMAWRSSARSAAGHSTSSDSSPDTDALIVASGVRRSCETARSRPVRNSSTAVEASAVSASCCEARVRSPATNWLPNELTRRRSSAFEAVPKTTSRFAASRSTDDRLGRAVAGSGPRQVGSAPAAAATCHVSPERVSSRAAVAPEREPELFEHGRHRIGLGDERRRRAGERLGLGASPVRLIRRVATRRRRIVLTMPARARNTTSATR